MTYANNLQNILDSFASDLHICMPGQIVSFDPAKQTCSLKPCLKRVFQNGSTVELPVIEDVPVYFPGSGNFWLTFDVVADSYCILVFAERSLANWIANGGIVDPGKSHKFSLSDCFAFVGVNPEPNSIDTVESGCIALRKRDNSAFIKLDDNDAITLENANGSVELAQNGKVSINGTNFTVDP